MGEQDHIEGETLGQYRARHGLPGTDTGAAHAITWRDGAWRNEHGGAATSAATTASEGTGASDPLLPADHPLAARPRPADAVGLAEGPFVPSAKAAAETVAVLRRVGEGDAAELARLLPGLAADIAMVGGVASFLAPTLGASTPSGRLARAAELLTRERERVHDILRPHHAPTRDGGDMVVTLARIVAERSALRDERATALRNVNARNIELTDALGAAEEERDALRARVAELEARVTPRPTAAPSRWSALPERDRRDVTGWLADRLHDSRHELEADAIEAHEALIALAEQAPMEWRAAGLIAKLKSEERSALATRDGDTEDRDERIHSDGYVKGMREAARLIRDAFPAPTPLDGVVAEVATTTARDAHGTDLCAGTTPEKHATIAAGVLRANGGRFPLTTRDKLVRGAAVCLAGLLACDAAKGGSHV